MAKVSSIVTACEKELADLKETMKNCKQVFYNMGFKDAEDLAGVVIFLVANLGSARAGWQQSMWSMFPRVPPSEMQVRSPSLRTRLWTSKMKSNSGIPRRKKERIA